METPVLFCIFNRPEVTRKTFEAIRRARVENLFVVADGPRTYRAGENELVNQTREIINEIDWPCNLKTNFSDSNLGCKYRMSSGISWAFEQTEQLIIVEDDCLPSDSFFGFCENLLHRYEDADDIMMISGDNFQMQNVTSDSYYFSKWAHIWGWATWRRAWNLYDLELESWPALRESNGWSAFVDSDLERAHWTHTFDQQHEGMIDTWDFPWMYTCWVNQGLCILPNVNLVSNLGFAADATHTTDDQSKLACMETHELDRLVHPDAIIRNKTADQFTWETIFKPDHSSFKKETKIGWWQKLKKLAS